MSQRVDHQEVVKKLLATKAVDFKAIGNTLSELGPSMALAEEPWEGFCGTMRTFVRVYRLNGDLNGSEVENLASLKSAAKELQR